MPNLLIDFGGKTSYPAFWMPESTIEERPIMEMESLEKLEEKVSELTRKFMDLKEGHQKILEELTIREKEIKQLNNKLKSSAQTKVEVHSRIENILKKLEALKAQAE